MLRVREILEATPTTRIVRLDLDAAPFTFRAGQSVLVGAHGQPIRKPYSMATAPGDVRRDRYLELLIKLEPSGTLGEHLGGLEPRTAVDVAGPVGSFVFPDAPAERAALFIAGGTGIAPLRAMIRHALESGFAGPLAVLYSARSPLEFAYGNELRDLARQGRIVLKLTVTREVEAAWEHGRGRIDAATLASVVATPATLCFVCGPPSLLAHVRPLLHSLGIDRNRVRMEEY